MSKVSFTSTQSDQSKTNAPSNTKESFTEPAKKYKLICLQQMALDGCGDNCIAC